MSMEWEPDWDDMDHRANGIIGRYALVSGAVNVLPMPFDMMAVTATFSKMATELAGVYQVIVSSKRARQIGWAIATTTATVLGGSFGAAFLGTRLIKFIPGAGYFVGAAIQGSMVGGVAWAAGDALKSYFRQTRQGHEPTLSSLQESFAKTLRLKLRDVEKTVEENTSIPTSAAGGFTKVAGKLLKRGVEKVMPSSSGSESSNGNSKPTSSAASASAAAKPSVSDAISQIAALHELMRSGAITEEEFEAKKKDLLARM